MWWAPARSHARTQHAQGLCATRAKGISPATSMDALQGRPTLRLHAAGAHRGDLILCGGVLGDLGHKVEQAVASVQGNVVPGGDHISLVAEEDAVVGGGGVALRRCQWGWAGTMLALPGTGLGMAGSRSTPPSPGPASIPANPNPPPSHLLVRGQAGADGGGVALDDQAALAAPEGGAESLQGRNPGRSP